MLHGWMDTGASFQFVIDALKKERRVIAPDWRGFGLTEVSQAPPMAVDHFWFPDYLADLDGLLDHYAPQAPVDLVAHSMGGNIAMLYAGARPMRVRRLVTLEGFGMPATQPHQAPARTARWLDEVQALRRGEKNLSSYSDLARVARRLMRTNPRLTQDKADWLAVRWARETVGADGRRAFSILGHPAHKVVNAYLYRVDELLAYYRAITAPVLAVEAAEGMVKTWRQRGVDDDFMARLHHVPLLRHRIVQNAGHMLHHDQPEQLAALIEDFLCH
jgi:pimeloyl-ACP methyl ester carboxylesterase